MFDKFSGNHYVFSSYYEQHPFETFECYSPSFFLQNNKNKIDIFCRINEIINQALLLAAHSEKVTKNFSDKTYSSTTEEYSAALNLGMSSVTSNTGDCTISKNDGNRAAAANTGYCSVSKTTGEQSVASNTGHRSAAMCYSESSIAANSGARAAALSCGKNTIAAASGKYSLAVAEGKSSIAISTGEKSMVEAKTPSSVAVSLGFQGCARAVEGGIIILCYKDKIGNILHIRAAKVGENNIKSNTWYTLDENGEFIEINKEIFGEELK